jgi:type IV secretory pathway VirB10-like protein
VHQKTLLTLLLLGTASICAETYRWVSEDGVVTYSQTPPPNTQVEVIKTPNAAPPSGANASRQRLKALRQQLADQEEDRALKKAEQEKKAKEKAVRESNCKAARHNLQQLTILANRLYKVGDEYIRLSEAQKQERIQQAKDQIEAYCEK